MSFARNLSNKYGKRLLNAASKAELDEVKFVSKKLVHKMAEAAGESWENKISEKFWKSKPTSDINSRDVEKMIISPEILKEILNDPRQIL